MPVQFKDVLSHPYGAEANKANDVDYVVDAKLIPSESMEATTLPPFDVMMLLDISGSMDPYMQKLKDHVKREIDSCPVGSRVHIFAFAANVQEVAISDELLVQEERDSLKARIDALETKPYTNLENAFKKIATHKALSGYHNFAVCFTDGEPTKGERDPKRLGDLLPTDKTCHIVSFTNSSSSEIALHYSKRNPNNIAVYIQTAAEMDEFKKVFPTEAEHIASDVKFRVEPEANVTLDPSYLHWQNRPNLKSTCFSSFLISVQVGVCSIDARKIVADTSFVWQKIGTFKLMTTIMGSTTTCEHELWLKRTELAQICQVPLAVQREKAKQKMQKISFDDLKSADTLRSMNELASNMQQLAIEFEKEEHFEECDAGKYRSMASIAGNLKDIVKTHQFVKTEVQEQMIEEEEVRHAKAARIACKDDDCKDDEMGMEEEEEGPKYRSMPYRSMPSSSTDTTKDSEHKFLMMQSLLDKL